MLAGGTAHDFKNLLTALLPSTRLFAVSGYSQDPIIARPAEYGFHGSLAKPARVDDLARLLAAHL